MKPLKVAFLWHMHQPNYELDNSYILPWVRFHAIKDYLDFPSLLYKFPKVKFNFNYVPILLDQIENITSGKIIDSALKLSRINPKDLTQKQKNQIINDFFVTNYENMIKPYQYYDKLHDKAKSGKDFSDQEILDLQVWYNLCWTGILTKNNVFYERLRIKQYNFTIEERNLLLKKQLTHINQITGNLKNLTDLGQIDVSFSPYNHPILPLLNDINSANDILTELDVSDIDFEYQNDAKFQIDSAIKKYNNVFGRDLAGMWPSEGSLSDDVLNMMIEGGLKWTATDEQVLKNSDRSYNDLEKYFPRKFESKKGEITLFFRDHSLSDKIGFTYTSWNPHKAVDDFFFELHNIRNIIIHKYGEFALDHACVSVILDGENCWEFYENLGLEFRTRLMSRLNDDEYFSSVTMSEASEKNTFLLPLSSIKSGSWINGNFEIWIGEEIHLKAWKILAAIREMLETAKPDLSKNKYKKAMDYIYKAESSDWFWWYYSRHWAPNKADFDVLFRYNLKKAVEIADLESPIDLSKSIWSKEELIQMQKSSGRVSTMHQVSE